jgi:phosphopantothenoylcysteine synthetase/decarboxylase
LTATETEDLAVRKRRAEGTPVTAETFVTWLEKFEREQGEAQQQANLTASGDYSKSSSSKKSKEKVVDKSGRVSGFLQFGEKGGGLLNLEAMEAACENAQRDEEEEEDDDEELGENVDEELFDVDDDDLDDLDFDDDDDEDEDEEPDI